MLPPLRKLAFEIQKNGYCFLFPHPISWDSKYRKVQYSSSNYSWKAFYISLLLNILISAGAAYNLFVHFIIRPRDNYNPGIIGLHIICVVVTGIPAIAAVGLYRHTQTLAGINALLEFEKSLRTKKFRSSLRMGQVDVAMIGIAAFLLPVPFVPFFSSLFFGFDPFYFVFGDILGDQNYEFVSPAIYVICLFIRACLTCCAFECGRTITLTVMLIIQLIETLQEKFRDMLNHKISDIKALQFQFHQFTFLSIVHTIYQPFLQKAITIGITIAFWAVVVGWVVIKARKLVPFFMYVMSLATWLIVFASVIIVLSLFSRFCARSDYLLWRLRLKAAKIYANSVSVVDDQFCRDNAWNLFGRLFNALLIF